MRDDQTSESGDDINEELAQETAPLDTQEVNKEQPEETEPQEEAQEKEAEPTEEPEATPAEEPEKQPGRLKRLLGTRKGKVFAGIIIGLVVIGAIIAIPVTRYAVLGLIIKKDAMISVIDSTTKRPVSNASVSLNGTVVKTDNSGTAVVKSVSVGEYTVKITKQFYSDQTINYTVPVFSAPVTANTKLVATGRQVTLTVTNTISRDKLEGVTVSASGTSEATSSDGSVIIILPADKDVQTATLRKDGYNDATATIHVNDLSAKNTVQLTPAGSVYYLSKITGKINVMKANLDGTGASVVVSGTGKESDGGTVLLSARDWKYSTLLSARENAKDKLFVIDSATDTLTTVDEGDASFSLIGWSGHSFIYRVDRNTTNYWDNHRQALKIYDADAKKLSTIYQTSGSGTNDYNNVYDTVYDAYIMDNELVYSRTFHGNGVVADASKDITLFSVNVSSRVTKSVYTFANTFISGSQLKLYKPQELYIRLQTYPSDPTFYSYENGKVTKANDVTDDKFNSFYGTYLISPSGDKTFWTEPRDGKNTLLIGDANAASSTQVASLSDFSAYGWYSDDYILLTKNSSELYIASSHRPLGATNQPLKITNYHKPQLSYAGYGYGYGGQ